jgi:hypothetical protein
MTLTPTEGTKEKGDEYAYSLELGLSYAFCIFGIAIPLHLSLGSLDSLVGKCLSFQAGVKKKKARGRKRRRRKDKYIVAYVSHFEYGDERVRGRDRVYTENRTQYGGTVSSIW